MKSSLVSRTHTSPSRVRTAHLTLDRNNIIHWRNTRLNSQQQLPSGKRTCKLKPRTYTRAVKPSVAMSEAKEESREEKGSGLCHELDGHVDNRRPIILERQDLQSGQTPQQNAKGINVKYGNDTTRPPQASCALSKPSCELKPRLTCASATIRLAARPPSTHPRSPSRRPWSACPSPPGHRPHTRPATSAR